MTTGVRGAQLAPRLLRAATRLPADLVLDAPARRVLEHDAGFLRLLGGPGTGKTTLLAERVARLLHADPQARSLVLVGDRRSAAALRERISARRRVLDGAVGATLTAAREPLVRSVHSYAFAVLRRHAARREEAPPRLLPGAQQDAMVRELLAGEAAGAGRGSGWPARLTPALEAPAFAAEVRDLLLRAAERGLGPRELRALGKEHDVAVWVAAARFYQTFEEVTLLRAAAGSANPLASAPPLDAAELVAAVLDAFATDPGLLASEREHVRHLVVDDAQDMDPQQLELARTLGATADAWVLAGDPDSSVLGFRGAAPDVLRDADPGGRATAVLTLDHRGSPAVRDAVARAVEPLRGVGPGRTRTGPPDAAPEGGAATVSVFPTPGRQAAWVADTLRRAHLVDGVPWSRLAVVVRSVPLSLPPLRRALLAAGVPLAVPADDTPLAALPAVAPLLTLLRCAATAATAPPASAIDADTALALLSSPLGGAEPLGLRRLRRGLLRLHEAARPDPTRPERSSDELIVDVLVDHLAGRPDPLVLIPDPDAAPLRRVARLLGAAVEAIRAGESVPDVVWAVWSAQRAAVAVGRGQRPRRGHRRAGRPRPRRRRRARGAGRALRRGPARRHRRRVRRPGRRPALRERRPGAAHPRRRGGRAPHRARRARPRVGRRRDPRRAGGRVARPAPPRHPARRRADGRRARGRAGRPGAVHPRPAARRGAAAVRRGALPGPPGRARRRGRVRGRHAVAVPRRRRARHRRVGSRRARADPAAARGARWCSPSWSATCGAR